MVRYSRHVLKMAEKSVLTSFRVRAAPKRWSKYTTIMYYLNNKLLKVLYSNVSAIQMFTIQIPTVFSSARINHLCFDSFSGRLWATAVRPAVAAQAKNRSFTSCTFRWNIATSKHSGRQSMRGSTKTLKEFGECFG